MSTEQNKKQLPAVRQHVGPIAPIVPADIDQLQRMANMMAASGFFQDARDMAQACVKIAAGAEYGLPPVVAMTGINVIKGRVTLSANTMAAIMKRAGYKLKTRFDGEQSCVITVIDPDGENLGESSFSMDDAKRAGLGGDNWRKYPRNMLFARAVSNAARWYAPEVLTGAITPEELGEVEEPPVIEVEVVEAEVVEDAEEAFHNKVMEIGGYVKGNTAEVVQKAEAALARAQAERRQLDQGDEEKPLPKSAKTILKEAKSEMSEEWKSANKTLRAALHAKNISDDQFKQMLGVGSMRDLQPALMRDAIKLLNSPMLAALRQMWGEIASEHTAQLAPLKDLLKDAMERSIPSADPRLSKAKCKGEDCGCEIYWGVSAKQKKNTCVDLGPIRSLTKKDGEKPEFFFVLDPRGELDLVETFSIGQGEQGVQAYAPHFSICPNAPHFKKGKAA